MADQHPKKHTLSIFYAGGQFFPLREHTKSDAWLKELLSVGLVAISDAVLITRDPFPKGILHLARTAQRVFEKWNKYHGFIIILERTNFLYFAAILSFMLGRLNKPVVFSCPPGDSLAVETLKYSDIILRASLVNAALTASGKMSGTVITVGEELIPVTHAIFFQKFDDISEQLVEGMTSADMLSAGWIDFGLKRNPTSIAEKKNLLPSAPQLHLEIADDVPLLHFEDYPTLQDLQAALPDIVIIKSKVQTAFRRESIPENKTVLLLEPEVLLSHNGEWSSIHWMTEETARAKFVWLVAQRRKKEFAEQYGTNIAYLMRRDFIGETLHVPLLSPLP